ncbi:MAG: DUF5666 domain-containing protein [Candidatus Moranbacteria bacterium]|nr:DUF5666 domain-containing protein [Candidatus Moranbacteria bacterium]
MKKIMTIAIIVAVVVGVGAFYGGTIYEKSSLNKQGLLRTAGTFGNRQGGQNGQGGANGQRSGGQNGQGGQGGANRGQGGGFLNGEIIAKDDPVKSEADNGAGKSITVKDRDGSSKIVFFSDSTAIGKSVEGSTSDLSNGQQVMINGQTNADGTITAQNIQIRPDQAPQSGQ